MTLLQSIQSAAIDGSTDLGTVLRQCKVLAARLESEPLQDWLIHESNGYPDAVPVPEYRVWSLSLKGDFSGPAGSAIRNAPIPMAVLDKEICNRFEAYECRQSVSSLEVALRESDSASFSVSTGDLALLLGMNVYQGYNCISVDAFFPRSHIDELLNTVRNRVLDFVLAIEGRDPMAGEEDSNQANIDSSTVTQIFNTVVRGGSANIVGVADDSDLVFNVNAGDLDAVGEALRAARVSEDDVLELLGVLPVEQPEADGSFGPRVAAWISGMMEKAANGSWQIGLGAGGNLLAELISKYYGL